MTSGPPFIDQPAAALDAAQLVEAIAFHNRAYFIADVPVIPDQEYDRLVERLRELDPNAAILVEIGGGADEAVGNKVEHATSMLSLDKCYDHAGLRHWARELSGSFVASPKVDGAACTIHYDAQGRLRLAATRGDGRQGESIGHNVVHIPNVPKRLPAELVARFAGRLAEVRGEIYMPLSLFEPLRELYANPRNVAAGSIKSKEGGGVSATQLRFFAYDLLGWPVVTELEKARLLTEMGFEPAPAEECDTDGAAAIHQRWLQARPEMDYEIDGVVFKIDDIAGQARLGMTAHHPRWAMAWKFQGDSGQTTLVDVTFSLSRTGTITPVAVVEPVSLSGASVTRATLHNLSNLRRLDLHVGDTLLLTRRGGVIPHVEGNRGGGTEAVLPPSACMSCGEPTVERRSTRRVSGEDVVTQTLHCGRPNDCPTVRRERLLHFTAVLDMDGFGDKIVDGLLERDLVHDAADLFILDEAALLTLPRMGELLARRLLTQIAATRQVSPAKLLVALGIDTMGRHAASLLASRWTLEEILSLTTEELAGLHSLGEVTAERIVSGLAEQATLIERLLAQVEVQRPAEATSIDGPLAGQLVVFTGALERLNRRDAQQLVVRLGGKAGSSITGKTTMVVVGGDGLSAARPSSKLKKANKLAEAGHVIRILSEEAFHEELP